MAFTLSIVSLDNLINIYTHLENSKAVLKRNEMREKLK
jgi:hypothetical protein